MQDEQILELFWQRSERAIREAKCRFGAMCQGIAWNLLRNEEDVVSYMMDDGKIQDVAEEYVREEIANCKAVQ